MTAQWMVVPRAADLSRRFDPVRFWSKLIVIERHNVTGAKAGAWSVTGLNRGLAGLLTAGNGVILFRDGVKIMSGDIVSIARGATESTVSGWSDTACLDDRLIAPNPTQPWSAQANAYDNRSYRRDSPARLHQRERWPGRAARAACGRTPSAGLRRSRENHDGEGPLRQARNHRGRRSRVRWPPPRHHPRRGRPRPVPADHRPPGGRPIPERPVRHRRFVHRGSGRQGLVLHARTPHRHPRCRRRRRRRRGTDPRRTLRHRRGGDLGATHRTDRRPAADHQLHGGSRRPATTHSPTARTRSRCRSLSPISRTSATGATGRSATESE